MMNLYLFYIRKKSNSYLKGIITHSLTHHLSRKLVENLNSSHFSSLYKEGEQRLIVFLTS